METYKIVMLAILAALEIPAAIFLVIQWVKACRESKRNDAVTARYCPHCHNQVIRSEVPGYAWQCLECDEDFYDFECGVVAHEVYGKQKQNRKIHHPYYSSKDERT